jgi:hypothetical protein
MPSASLPIASAPIAWDLKLVAGLILAAAIAWMTPFDLAFGAATLGAPVLRAGGIVVLALAGLYVARRIDLGVESRGTARPVLTSLLWAAGVGVGCAAFDWMFRPILHGGYVAMLTSAPLGSRIVVYMMRAFNENILYRLFLGSVLIWVIGQVWKAPDGRPATGAYWVGFSLAQAINVWINVTSQAPVTPTVLLHDGLRYFAPGMAWSWLYWKRGFQSNEIASTSVHLVFQPLVTLGLG